MTTGFLRGLRELEGRELSDGAAGEDVLSSVSQEEGRGRSMPFRANLEGGGETSWLEKTLCELSQ